MRITKYLLIIAVSVLSAEVSVAKVCAKTRIHTARNKIIKQSAGVSKQVSKKQPAVVVASGETREIDSSVLVKRLESEWKQLDIQVSHITRRILTISRDVNAQNSAFASKLMELDGQKGSEASVVAAHCKNTLRKRYGQVSDKWKVSERLKVRLEALRSQQKNVEQKICDLVANIRKVYKKTCIENQLINDTIFDISKKTNGIEDLFRKVNLEVQAGAFSTLVRCKSFAPNDYPVEAVFIDKEIKQFDKCRKLVLCNITTRSGSSVISPYFGTVVFLSNVPCLGSTIVISNSEADIMICGLDDVFCSVGNVVRYGQVLGTLPKNIIDCDYSLLKYAILSKN